MHGTAQGGRSRSGFRSHSTPSQHFDLLPPLTEARARRAPSPPSEKGAGDSGRNCGESLLGIGGCEVTGRGTGKLDRSSALRILLIDNYDSFTYNLAFLLAQVNEGQLPVIVFNDAYEGNVDLLLASLPHPVDCIVISPGPGRPSTVGLSYSCLTSDLVEVPILGVCLGMQTIAIAFGVPVIAAPSPMHGRCSRVRAVGDCSSLLLKGLDLTQEVVRYHSLCAALELSSPLNREQPLVATLVAQDDGCVMALEHHHRPVFGVQFHPESIGAGVFGLGIVRNFLALAGKGCSTRVETPLPSPSLPLEKRSRFQSSLCFESIKVHSPNLDCESVFASLFLSSPHCVWLDSSKSGSMGRVSILAAGTERIECFIDERFRARTVVGMPSEACLLRVSSDTSHRYCRGLDIFTYLGQRLAQAHVDADSPVGFVGGFIGVLGYGLRNLACPRGGGALNSTFEWHESPKAASWQGDADVGDREPDASFVYCPRAIVYNHDSGEALVLSVLPNDQVWIRQHARAIESPSAALPPPRVTHLEPLVPTLSQEAYCGRVNQCISHLRQGDSYEICLTNLCRSPSSVSDAWNFYRQVRSHNPAPFSAFFPLNPSSTLCCTSPERFLSVRGRNVESRPIKGTRPRATSVASDERLAEELARSVKDRAENMMIVDLTRNDLSRVCKVGSVSVPQMMRVESYAVHQLVSAVVGELEEVNHAVDAVRAVFPPPSMTGAPKLKTMQLIDDLEDAPRGLYSGVLGYFSLNGDADFNVIIRSAVVGSKGIVVGAGGAVTVLSDPQGEYEEMLLKVRTLGLAVKERQEGQ